jgi:prepilin-type processing-associated H-X9-DG protein
MKPCFSKKGRGAFTRVDMAVLVGAAVLSIAILIPMLIAARNYAIRTKCVDNLKQITLNCRDWEADNNNKYPMAVSVTNGGAMETAVAGDVAHCFQVMSNELKLPKYLICPADRKHVPATNWTTDFDNFHISYFINPNADEMYPQEVLMGDDNLAVNGLPVKSGLLVLATNASISWAAGRHGRVNNISFADGSISGESSSGLRAAFQLAVPGTPIATNRLAIP